MAFRQSQRRDKRDAEMLENSFGEALFVNRQITQPSRKFGSQENLAKVVSSLVEFIETSRVKNQGLQDPQSIDHQLQHLLSSSGMVGHKALLPNHWWKSGGMALVAWTQEGWPVALRAAGRNGYMFFNPKTGRTGRVNQEFAETLLQTAHMIYPTLLENKVKFRDIVNIGFRPGMKDVALLAIFGAIAALVGLITPSITAFLVNTVIPQSEQQLVFELSAILFAVAIITAMFRFLQSTALLRVETLFESHAQAALWHRLLRMPSDLFRRFSSGNLALRITSLSQIRTILSQGVVIAVLGGIFSSLNLIVMINYGGWLTVSALIISLITITFAVIANMLKLRHLRRVIAAQQELAGQSTQAIWAINKLRVAGAEKRVLSRLLGVYNKKRFYDYSARSIENIIRSVNVIVPLLSTIVFFAVIEFFFESPIQTGSFVAFTVAYGGFIVGITGLINSITMALVASVIYEQLRPILETSPDRVIGSAMPAKQTGRIEANQLNFKYQKDGARVLSNVSFSIEPGQFVAIVGPSGSGKSTLFRLLLGFERPQIGSIFYDGMDLAKMDVGALRQQFGVVLQNAQVLGGTILENISSFRAVTMKDAWEAAERASLAETIRAMPMQMHTPVIDGSTISGGEKQRLLLARALAGKPSVLFLDEATSALDNITQAAVTNTLSNLDVTRIVIAHRLSTVRNADVIFVMNDGKIVEVGNAQTLLEKGGMFSSLVERQLK